MATMASAAIGVDSVSVLRAATRQIRILIVDEHLLVQEGLSALIHREEDMTVVATASSGREAMDAVRRHRPDLVTLDLLLPDMPGEELARRNLRGHGSLRSPPPRVICTRGGLWTQAFKAICRRRRPTVSWSERFATCRPD